jgi:hypothetical protein
MPSCSEWKKKRDAAIERKDAKGAITARVEMIAAKCDLGGGLGAVSTFKTMPRASRKYVCDYTLKKAAQAFKQGDNERGRKLYHLAAERGCSGPMPLEGLKSRKRRRARRRTRR